MSPDSPLKQIRTFQGDVAEALSRQNESLVSIQQTEQFKRRVAGIDDPATAAELEATKRRRGFFFFLVGSIFFIALGLLGAWYGYHEFVRKTAPPRLSMPANRFISPTSEVSIDLSNATRETLIAAFSSATMGLSPEELRHVVGRSGREEDAPLVKTAEFLKILESRAPGNLVRAFESLFMLGALGESPFLIIKLASFENAFPGMLAWEANLAQDLGPLLSTAELVKAIVPASVFKDVIMKNKDIRVLELSNSLTPGEAPRTILLYSFFDNNTLIITDDIETLQTLIDQLTREKLSR